MRGDAFVDSCDLHACLVVLRQAMRVRPEGVLLFRSCSHCLTVFVMSLIILITIRMCRSVLIKKRSTIHLQTVLTLTHRLQTMSVDFVTEKPKFATFRSVNNNTQRSVIFVSHILDTTWTTGGV